MHQVLDPVCWEKIDSERAQGIIRFGGRLHYFCCKECRWKFIRNPGKYLKGLQASGDGASCCHSLSKEI